jgi:thiol-disulfide isomerase/thioredoxin
MPNGRAPIKLSQYKGKVIALEFILTYCSHCQRASRTSDIIYREYGPKGFQVIAAAINPGGDTVAYARDLNLTFPVGSVSQETCTTFMQHPAMLRLLMPQMAFIDRNFKVAAQYSGDAPFFGETEEKNMRELLDKLLKPAGAPAPTKKASKKS